MRSYFDLVVSSRLRIYSYFILCLFSNKCVCFLSIVMWGLSFSVRFLLLQQYLIIPTPVALCDCNFALCWFSLLSSCTAFLKHGTWVDWDISLEIWVCFCQTPEHITYLQILATDKAPSAGEGGEMNETLSLPLRLPKML